MDFTTAGMVTSVRRRTATLNSRVVTDDEVIEYLQDALTDLYDAVVTEYEDGGAFRTSGVFTLAGAVTFDLHTLEPAFYKLLGLDFLKSATDVETVHRAGSYQGRNRRSGTREYQPSGSDLLILPNDPAVAAGQYRIHYVPQCPELVAPISISPTPYTRSVGVNALLDQITRGTSAQWELAAGAFTAADLGGVLTMGNCANPGNNGPHTITTILAAVEVATPLGTTVDEAFTSGLVTASVTRLSIEATTRSLSVNAAAFDVTFVGATITITGSASNDGDWIVASVPNAHTVVLAGTATLTNESFGGGVAITYVLANKVVEMPSELRPWREAVVVGASIAVATKRNMTDLVGTLLDRFARLQARIVKAAANRDANEPMQAPIVGERMPGRGGGRDPDSVV